MKYLLNFLFIIFLFGCSPLSEELPSSTEPSFTDDSADEPVEEPINQELPDVLVTPEFIDVELQEDPIDPFQETIELTIVNRSEYELTTGEYYKLDYHDGKNWVEVPMDAVFQDIGISIPPNRRHTFEKTFFPFDTADPSGRYRLRKEFTLQSPDISNFEIGVEFFVEEESTIR